MFKENGTFTSNDFHGNPFIIIWYGSCLIPPRYLWVPGAEGSSINVTSPVPFWASRTLLDFICSKHSAVSCNVNSYSNNSNKRRQGLGKTW